MNHNFRPLFVAAALAVAGLPAVASAPAAPTALLTEHLSRPLGVNTATPRFSWKNGGAGFSSQSAYEILVGTDSLALVRGDKADLWQSGRVESSASHLVKYAGRELPARTQGWWKVRVWNSDGTRSGWSDVARFGVGVLEDAPVPIQGSYIGMPEGNGDMTTPLLRSTLSIDRLDGRVMAHVNPLGYHELYVNGHKAGANVLSPGMSQLDRRSLIVTYDITPLLAEGQNDIVLRLGQGWYKPNLFKAEYGGPVARIEIDRVKGTESHTLLTGDSPWQAAAGGRTYTGTWYPLQFGGEKVDGRTEPADMSPATLAALTWVDAARPSINPRTAIPEESGNNGITASWNAVSVKPLADGSYMADMGKVLTGWFSMDMPQLPAGTEVTMEYSDNLTAQGEFDPQGEADVYVAAGRPGESFSNKFHHHAYRYVIIRGLDKAPAPETLHAHRIHGEYADASSFACSDADLQAVHDMIKYTMKCLTFSGYMVDCPHLERMGYGGDGNASTLTLQTMYDVAPTYTNWVRAWGDVLDPDGSLPHVAPAGGGGGGPYWCAFLVLAPWRTWLNYGDTDMLATYYPMMKKWMGYVEAYTRDGLLQRWPDTHNRGWYLGDWLAPAGVDAGNSRSVDLVNNCVVSECLAKMESAARTLGLNDEADKWRARRLDLNAKIHYTFYDHATAEYATGSQLDMSYPMLVGVTPDYLRDTVRDRMLELSHTRWRDHIGAGLVGVPIVTEWAISERQPDFMATMLRQRDYPGYLYMIDNGATATWEYWNGERSRVHNCYNGVGLWFYRALGGIVPDEAAPGYEHFFIDPQPAQGVDWAEVTKETPYGTASLRWERKDGGLEYAVTVPAGSTATVRIPCGMTPVGTVGATAEGIRLGAGSHTISFR